MPLIKTFQQAKKLAASPSKLIEAIWKELTAHETRLTTVESNYNTFNESMDQIEEQMSNLILGTLSEMIETVSVNVSTGNMNGSSAADSRLINGKIIGFLPVGNMDQLIDNLNLNADGSVTVTLAENATTQNQFKISVIKTNMGF